MIFTDPYLWNKRKCHEFKKKLNESLDFGVPSNLVGHTPYYNNVPVQFKPGPFVACHYLSLTQSASSKGLFMDAVLSYGFILSETNSLKHHLNSERWSGVWSRPSKKGLCPSVGVRQNL